MFTPLQSKKDKAIHSIPGPSGKNAVLRCFDSSPVDPVLASGREHTCVVEVANLGVTCYSSNIETNTATFINRKYRNCSLSL